jgi:hypothetical protein
VEVRYEGEEELRGAEDEHVVAAVVAAGRIVPVLVVAVGLQNRPATIEKTEQPQRNTNKASKHSQGKKKSAKINQQQHDKSCPARHAHTGSTMTCRQVKLRGEKRGKFCYRRCGWLPYASGGGDGIGDAAAVQAHVLQRAARPGVLLA